MNRVLGCAVLVLAVAGLSARASEPRPAPRVLRVCADPNNLPFSNRAGEGFENKLAVLMAKELHRRLLYVWWSQVRGYVRKTLNENKCDLWPGVASGLDTLATTPPYYRSVYVFVSRRSAPLAGLTLDDPRLKESRIGVQLIGNDAMNSPPAQAVASRGLIDNVRGYMVYGDHQRPHSSAIVDAVATNQIDVALVWGPLAGYFAHRSATPLRVESVRPSTDGPWPMVFEIAMGVRCNDSILPQEVGSILHRRQSEIEAILRGYGVPRANALQAPVRAVPVAARANTRCRRSPLQHRSQPCSNSSTITQRTAR